MAAPEGYQPVDVEAEKSIVAALLTAPSTFDDITELLTVEDFGNPALQEIYRAVVACENTGRPFDAITVADELKRAKMFTKCGGMDGLNKLVAFGAGIDSVMAHAQIVSERALLRRLVDAGREIAGQAQQPSALGKDVLELAEAAVFELGRPRSGSSMIPMAQAVAEMTAELANYRGSVLIGHSTGWAELDKLTGGLQGGQLVTIAARPSMGKSAFALQLADHVAETTGLTVPFLSYEMSRNELTMRMLARRMRYDLMKLRQGDLAPGMDGDMAAHAQKMAQLPMLIDDNPPETISGVRSAMRRLARRGELGLIVIDYTQLMTGEGRFRDSNRTQEISEITRGMKRMASDLNVTVVALSQLNRSLEQRPNKRPMLSDLRESGSIEQDSNAVIFLYRPHVYDEDADPGEAEAILAKNRQGPTGTIPLRWHGSFGQFDNTDRAAMIGATGANNRRAGAPAGGGRPFGGSGSGSHF